VERAGAVGDEEDGRVCLGAVSGKAGKLLFVNFVLQVSPACDCYGYSDAAIVPDLGILASTDPVALDRPAPPGHRRPRPAGHGHGSGHEPGGDKFRGVHRRSPGRSLSTTPNGSAWGSEPINWCGSNRRGTHGSRLPSRRS